VRIDKFIQVHKNILNIKITSFITNLFFFIPLMIVLKPCEDNLQICINNLNIFMILRWVIVTVGILNVLLYRDKHRVKKRYLVSEKKILNLVYILLIFVVLLVSGIALEIFIREEFYKLTSLFRINSIVISGIIFSIFRSINIKKKNNNLVINWEQLIIFVSILAVGLTMISYQIKDYFFQ